MKIIEFRVLIPISLAKFQIAKRFINLQYIKDLGGDGEGIELIKNEEPFENENEKGYLTEKVYHVKSKIPGFIRWAVPDKYLHFYETSYNAFPHTTTINSIPPLGDDFILKVESQHMDANVDFNKDTGENSFIIPDNVMNLPDNELKERKIVYIDILNGPASSSNYTDDGNETEVQKKTRSGIRDFVCPEIGLNEPLGKFDPTTNYNPEKIPAWAKKYNGEMALIVKVVHFHLKWFGLQTAVEKLVSSTFYPKLFTEVHRKIILSSTQWKSLTIEDIKNEEERIKNEQKNEDTFVQD